MSKSKTLIRNGRAKDALNLLRGRCDERKEVIVLMGQLSKLELDVVGGLHTNATERVEYQRLSKHILILLDKLATED